MVTIEAIADNIKLKLEYDGNIYHLQVEDTGFDDPTRQDNATERKMTMTCSREQASAIMALLHGMKHH